MKEFNIRVTQNYKGFYVGDLIIEASSKKAALDKAKKLSQDQLNELVHEWEQADDTFEDGPIEIDENSIYEIE